VVAEFYVYCIFRPDGRPCYIGKGQGDRLNGHFRYGKHPNRHLRGIIAAAGGSLPAVIVHDGLDEPTAFAYEKALIAAIGKTDLCNRTDGGDGTSGHKHTAETIAKMSVAQSGRTFSPETLAKMAAAKTGRSLTPEHRAAIGAANRGKTRTPDQRAAMSAERKGQQLTPEQKAKHAAVMSSRIISPETRAAMSANRLGKPLSKETKAKISVSVSRASKGKPKSAEHRAAMSASKTGTTHSLEHCEKIAEGVRRAAQERRERKMLAERQETHPKTV